MDEEREEIKPAGDGWTAHDAPPSSEVEVWLTGVMDQVNRLRLEDQLAQGMVDTHLLASLERLDMTDLDAATLVEVVAAAERLTSHVRGLQLAATAALAERMEMNPPGFGQHTRGPAEVASDELSLRLRCTRRHAQTMVRRSRTLTTVLATTGDALTAGLIDLPRAAAIVDGLDGVAWQVAELVEDQVLPRAPQRTARQVRADVAAALIDVDPTEAEDRAARRRDQRHVSRPRALPDGVASMRIEGPAADVLTFDLALDHAARGAKARGDARTLDQLRFDCLAMVGQHALATGHLGAAEIDLPLAAENGRRPQIQVRVSLADLIPPHSTPMEPDEAERTERTERTDPTTGKVAASARDGHSPQRAVDAAPILAGYGPITPTAARALAAGGLWQRVVTDPMTGAVLDVGRTRYRPTAAIA